MAITSGPFYFYDKSASYIMGATNLLSDTIKVALLTSSYTPNATHEFYDAHITGEVANGSGYTTGGITLSSKVLNSLGSGGFAFVSAEPTWTPSGTSLTAKWYVVYNDTPSSSKPLLGYGPTNYNSGSPIDVTAADGVPFIITLPTNGWFFNTRVNGA